MGYLILVKHSLPEIEQGVPPPQWHLGEQGKRQARTLAERLEAYAPKLIVSSREPKAIETAEIVAERFGLENRVVKGLHEHERERIGWLERDELQRRIGEFFAKPGELVLGDETGNAARERFGAAVERVKKDAGDVTAIVVAHGTVMSLYLEPLIEKDGFEIWKRLGLPAFVVLEDERVVELCQRNLARQFHHALKQIRRCLASM